MNLSKANTFTVHFASAIYILFFGALLIYSTVKVLDTMPKNKFTIPLQISMSSFEQSKNSNPSVVELFTSEGCSSCPSADKLVAKAQNEFEANTIVLSYHVDYWDRLGWKDPFSRAAFSERQRQYAQHLNLESVYTPQAIVNGKTEFVGSNKSALWNAINNYKSSSNIFIETEMPMVKNQQLSVKYNYAVLEPNEKLVFELVLKNATTQVKRGENSGASLSHINIVEDIIEKNEKKGIVNFMLPVGFIKENYTIVAFVQNTTSFEITNAKKITII
jgi:hypothetical protein